MIPFDLAKFDCSEYGSNGSITHSIINTTKVCWFIQYCKHSNYLGSKVLFVIAFNTVNGKRCFFVIDAGVGASTVLHLTMKRGATPMNYTSIDSS